MIIRILKKSKPEEVKKALTKLSRKRRRKQKSLSSFYGKLPKTFGNGLTYQKQLRDEW